MSSKIEIGPYIDQADPEVIGYSCGKGGTPKNKDGQCQAEEEDHTASFGTPLSRWSMDACIDVSNQQQQPGHSF